MENSNHSPLQLLYIGTNEGLINELRDKTDKFNITQFDNGLKAHKYLNSNEIIDAIICEVQIGGMNVLEYVTLIRGNQNFTKTPIILVAFEKNNEFLKKALAAKGTIDDLYFPPIKTDQLYSRILSIKKYYTEIIDKKITKKEKYEYKIPFLKRTFDIIVSSIVILLISPILIIVALAIRLESKGPIVYKSKRVGTGYKIFDFLKFRSMYTGADAKLAELKHLNQYSNNKTEKDENNNIDNNCQDCAKLPEGQYCSPLLYIKGQKICESYYFKLKKEKGDSAFIKISNDPRITKVGNFIRNTSIDELPQLINVLKGDMSIVGNRPLPMYEAELLTSDDWSLRFMGPAGITGLWQVELRGKKGVMSEEERKMLDNQYAKNYSFWGDIKLILRTIPALFQKDNV
ncbi:MAG: sugar transferase [Marinilabiliales bacterium]|nr:MAG: sugar transferase [Marinilabiliales bacterium]